ncbi:hypothetical protein I7I50_06457 [Histoplasma capsulatum G186AR]|uniref:Uncharacterized protein n=1 Tax=Ajellomyces capsulatus TaxID=5037 RepID=A0A8H8D369_AJECA|nr:hypothetical protein I7I52_10471 [Histoplasma capsulatum]QSS67396.1 hypothetical protein I7I50_06457 [Histoplasma capsulatum G186AR]
MVMFSLIGERTVFKPAASLPLMYMNSLARNGKAVLRAARAHSGNAFHRALGGLASARLIGKE